MKLSETKSYHIQILRGFAIIAVVFIHNTPDGLLQVWCRPFLNFAVGLFLFLSGMLSDVEKWNPKKRIIKVIVPYMIWSFIYVIMANYRNPALIPIEYISQQTTQSPESLAKQGISRRKGVNQNYDKSFIHLPRQVERVQFMTAVMLP